MKKILQGAFVWALRFPFMRGVLAQFDAAFQGYGERSWIFQALQDAWLEINAITRTELQRVNEYLIENSPVVSKIRSLKLQFSVGPAGLKVVPESSDEGYNDARSVSWEAWWRAPELGSPMSGAQLTRVWAGLLFDRGEIFVQKTFEDVPMGRSVKRIPRLRTIDAHRVKTPGGMSQDPRTGFPIIDGKVINPKTGACVAYFVKKTDYTTFVPGSPNLNTEEFDRLDAGDVIHKFKMRRPGQMRGIPDGTSGFNLVRDNMDLLKLEMQCAKLAAEVATVETNPAGELSTRTARQVGMKIPTQTASGVPTTKNAQFDYNVTLAGKKIALRTGDTLKQFQIDRPSIAQQGYWDLHYTLICMAWEVPKLLVMPYSLQGTVTRADLDVCAQAFRVDFEILRELCEEIYAWQGKWEREHDTTFTGAHHLERIKNGPVAGRNAELLVRAGRSRWAMDEKSPDDAHVCLIRPPRAPNVDIGYTAQALAIELEAGVKTYQDVFAERNQDWRTQLRQNAEAAKYIDELAKEFGVTPERIAFKQFKSIKAQPAGGEDDPEKTKTEEEPATA